MIDIFTGFKIRNYKDYTKEVCYLGYSPAYNLLISSGLDKQVRIYKDFNEYNKKQDKDGIL
jgi:WD40 repeat protein